MTFSEKYPEVYNAARKTREWINWIIDNDPEGYPEDAEGLCAIASAYLHRELQEVGVHSKIVRVDLGYGEHCFVETNKLVVDVTATQFGSQYNEIEIRPRSKKTREYEPWQLRGRKVFTGLRPFVQWCTSTGWPFEQNPSKFIKA